MLTALLVIMTPFLMLMAMLVGIGITSGKMPHPVVAYRIRKNLASEHKPVKEQNRCQCGHMKSFHEQGEGECHGPLHDPTNGKPMDRLCSCQGYLSSILMEISDEFTVAKAKMVDFRTPAIEAPKPKKVYEGEVQ